MQCDLIHLHGFNVESILIFNLLITTNSGDKDAVNIHKM